MPIFIGKFDLGAFFDFRGFQKGATWAFISTQRVPKEHESEVQANGLRLVGGDVGAIWRRGRPKGVFSKFGGPSFMHFPPLGVPCLTFSYEFSSCSTRSRVLLCF